MHLSSLLLLSFLFAAKQEIPGSIYDFKVAALDGGTIDFAKFKGQKILIVNTASKCVFTEQYDALEQLSKKYGDKLVIVGFPSNSFFFQEPGSDEKIGEFCRKNYGVTFPMAAKIPVRGTGKAPIYEWLTKRRYNHYKDSKVKWNFQKYLINEDGQLVAIFNSNVKPDSKEILEAIEARTIPNPKKE